MDTARLGLKAMAADSSVRQNFDGSWESFQTRFLDEFFSDEQNRWETFQTFRNPKQGRRTDFVSTTEKLLYELSDDAIIARIFKMH